MRINDSHFEQGYSLKAGQKKTEIKTEIGTKVTTQICLARFAIDTLLIIPEFTYVVIHLFSSFVNCLPNADCY